MAAVAERGAGVLQAAARAGNAAQLEARREGWEGWREGGAFKGSRGGQRVCCRSVFCEPALLAIFLTRTGARAAWF
eukprot:1279467-Rhodomonas_salina.1